MINLFFYDVTIKDGGDEKVLFDTHVHLNIDHFQEDLEEVITRAQDAGVERMLVVGFNEETIPRALELAETYDFMYAAVGWHPVDAIDMTEEHLAWIEECASHEKVVAIGEMGLDYHWDKSPADVQKKVFREQIALAKRVQLPIVIHNRDASEDIVAILKEENAHEVGGIMHCFNSDQSIADACLDMGFYLSFGGPVTFKNAKNLKEVAKEVPLERMLIETDCPFLAPHPNRGKRNEPAYVKLVAEQLAELKGVSYEEIVRQTTSNAEKLFQI
ncbi:TatD DNase family protein [Texcoconibacillus texcoconensis]|uniref:TatD DNase family protein n=1 Tax=Texcoconibacillus texcoconensis TaxID=1095777 RepID=A0A840QUF3_9BACI|nr:TatD family hydrolase [Texcoconibacillus texcoconensis]MBB5174918.1 TatD DNase family protein [Texcoconibacillus texcoconensis]